jgi:uncharacterized protein YihD (DUF1040 family)
VAKKMRDKKRIPYMLHLIKEYWEKHPELRLCQLLSNVALTSGEWNDNDLFYLEDETLFAALNDKLMEEE